MKTLASKINQASFLLKTTEVTARLFLVVSIMMQGSGAPKARLPCPLSPCGAHALGRHHPASFCTTCQGKMLTKELYSPPALTPPAQWGRWHRYCFQRRAKAHYQNVQDDGDHFCNWEYCSEMQAVTGYSCHGDHHTVPMLLRCYQRAECGRGSMGSQLNTTLALVGDLIRSHICHRFVLWIWEFPNLLPPSHFLSVSST